MKHQGRQQKERNRLSTIVAKLQSLNRLDREVDPLSELQHGYEDLPNDQAYLMPVAKVYRQSDIEDDQEPDQVPLDQVI